MINGKRKVKRVHLGTDRVIDGDGVVLAEYNRFRDEAVKSKYAFMYLDDNNYYECMSALGNTGKVFAYVIKHSNPESCIFNFTATRKESMVRELGLSIGTIRSAVASLCGSFVLIRIIGSEYMVNPNLIYKGYMEKRQSAQDMFDRLKRQFEERKLQEIIK